MTCEATTISASGIIRVEENEFVGDNDGDGSPEVAIENPAACETPKPRSLTPFVEDPETGIWHHTGIRSPKGVNKGPGDEASYTPDEKRRSQRARGNLCRPRGR